MMNEAENSDRQGDLEMDKTEPMEQMEKFLRQWGAAEAVEGVKPPPAVFSTAAGTGRGRVLLRWVPLAAAAGLLVAATGLFVASRSDSEAAATSGIETAAAQEKVRQLETQLAQRKAADDRRHQAELDSLREQVKHHKAAMLQADGRRMTAEATYRGAVNRMDRELAEALRESRELREAAEAARVQRAEGTKNPDEQNKQLAAAKSDAETARKLLAAAKNDTETMRKLLAAATRDAEERKQALSAVTVEARAARDLLAAAKSRAEKLLGEFRRAYLAVAAPRQEGLPAFQAAARRTDMLSRCAAFRDADDTPSDTAGLLDRLEVILTRLDMLDPHSASDAAALAGLVRTGDIRRRIDAALDAGGQTPPLRTWLLEAKLVLTGAERVG